MSRIEFCETNLTTAGSFQVRQEIEKMINTDIQIQVLECIGYCFDCSELPYVVIDEEVIQAKTPGELLKKVKERL